MGGKYEVRWKFNGRCPFWCSVFTNSLLRALWLYVKAVCKGNTRVDLAMHAWKDCRADCKNREWLCDARPDNLKPLRHHHFIEAQKRRRNAEKPEWATDTHETPKDGHSGHENDQCGEIQRS